MTTHLDQHGHAHKPAGSPDGGQFTTRRNDAPTSTLGALDAPKLSSELTAEAIRGAQDVLTRTARAITRSFRIDETNAEDIVQDSWVHLMERDTRKSDIAARMSEKAFLGLTARKYGNNYGNDARFGLRSEDFRARREIRAREDAFYEANGRKFTPTERETIADEIRMSFPAGGRPRPDFYKEISQLSLDVPLSKSVTYADTLIHEDRAGFDAQEDAAALALHTFENKQATKNDILKDMWRIMTTRHEGTPQPVPNTVSKRSARTARTVMKSSGGVHTVSLLWLDGESTQAQTDALFAPFGKNLTAMQQQQVFNILDDNPTMADNLWAASLTAATQ